MSKILKRKAIVVLSAVFAAMCFFALVAGGYKVNADTNDFYLADGAECRIVEGESGLRFTAEISKDYYDGLTKTYGGENISAGMIIVPSDYVAAAGGITFNALSSLGKQILSKDTETFSLNGGVYSYSLSIVNILENNYTRDFSAAGYIKSATAIDGFTEYGGSYYRYTPYDETVNSRSIYEIAYKAYTEGGYETDETVKGFIDPVAVIDVTDGVPHLSNAHELYTPVFTIEDTSSGYILNTNGNALYAVLYNGERKPVGRITDVDVSIDFMLSQNAEFDGEGGVSLATKHTYTYSTNNIASMGGKGGNDYIAFKGDYGIGTYVTVTFTGNNMPTVCFFANEINADMTNTTEGNTGIMAISGMYADGDTATPNIGLDQIKFYGPNRIDANFSTSQPNCYYWWDYRDLALLTQKGMIESGAQDEYLYSVGVIEEDGVLAFDMRLYRMINGVPFNVYSATRKLAGESVVQGSGRGEAVTKDMISSGNIIIYAQSKDSGNTEFGYSAPTSGFVDPLPIKQSGFTINADGSLSTHMKQVDYNTSTTAGKWAAYYNYLAFTGNYGAGYYLDFSFKGNNMPQVMFFAKTSDDDTAYQSITNYGNGTNGENSVAQGRKGVVVLNGFNNVESSQSVMQVFGPERMTGTMGEGGSGYLLSLPYSEYPELTQKGLLENPDKEYLYTIGTFVRDGEIQIDIVLKDKATGTVIHQVSESLGLTEEDAGTGDIIIYPPFMGDNVSCTIDSFSAPYKKA